MEQYQEFDFRGKGNPASATTNSANNITPIVFKRKGNYLNLSDRVNNRDDWNGAFELAEEIYSQLPNKEHSSFINMASKMLLSTSVLFAFSSWYPDILTAKSLLLLPQLRTRLILAAKQPISVSIGIEVAVGFQYFLECPSSQSQAIVTESIKAIDLLLTQSFFGFSADDFKLRSIYLERVLPLIDFDNN